MSPLTMSDSVATAARETATLLALCGAAAIGVIATLFFLLVRRRSSVTAKPATAAVGRPAAAWLLATLVGGGILFHVGVGRAVGRATPEPDALEVLLTFREDDLELVHPNGSVETRDWVLPAGRNLALTFRSEDGARRIVSPELGVELRLERGVERLVPARFTGANRLRLVEADGSERSIRLIPDGEYETLLRGGPKNPYCTAAPCTEEQQSRWGKELFEQNACVGCHSRDGSRLVGPTFRGLFGRSEAIKGGETVTVDAVYIAESIRKPTAKVVDGYAPVMPAFPFNDRQVEAIVAYAKTLEASPR